MRGGGGRGEIFAEKMPSMRATHMEKNGNHKAKRMKITNTLRNIRKIRKMQKETLLVQYFPVLITCFPSMVAFFLCFT